MKRPVYSASFAGEPDAPSLLEVPDYLLHLKHTIKEKTVGKDTATRVKRGPGHPLVINSYGS